MTYLWNKIDFNIGVSLQRERIVFLNGRRRKEMGKRKKGRRKKRGEKDRKKLILLVTNISSQFSQELNMINSISFSLKTDYGNVFL